MRTSLTSVEVSNSGHGGLLELLLDSTSFPDDDEGPEWSMLSTSKPDPLNGNRAVTAAPYRCQASGDAVIGREHEALVDEFFDRIDDELLGPEANIAAGS